MRKVTGRPLATGGGGGEKFPIVIERACGHEETILVFSDRGTYLDNQRERECSSCYRAAVASRDQQAVDAGRRAPLDGSDKQVGWAQGIRERRAQGFSRLVGDIDAAGAIAVKRGEAAVGDVRSASIAVRSVVKDIMAGQVEWETEDDGVLRSDNARWWIETRTISDREMVSMLIEGFRLSANGTGYAELFAPAEQPTRPAPSVPAKAPSAPAEARPASVSARGTSTTPSAAGARPDAWNDIDLDDVPFDEQPPVRPVRPAVRPAAAYEDDQSPF